MKRLLVTLMAVLLGLLATACAQQEVEEEPHFLEVELTANPEKAQLNEEVTFEAKVTYGTEEVKDADEVKFEIWRSQAEEHEKIVVEHDENGIYRWNKAFEEEGTYYFIAHVTARSMHNMPKIEFVIGNPSEPEENGKSNEMDMEDHDTEAEEENGH
ncbi:FixH family protein [Mesobacillus selenatarsenatis]|uniref:Alternate gene name yznA n=1 Tax=Mesobacillus selenatarsenatis (strain DSM 18680 / JCM 14380 / FERM P-15431 / SF-1) TaxID=1321606 RepID=A0A0A8X9X8_MESS1|nr:FixH family protein [Mesobacillus selenatarsenatis]GAM16743.1 alternate gene name yznA [Mesobacillus selenatarsenatis SF-1]